MKFQYYANSANKPEPLGFISLDLFLNKIKNPSNKTISVLSEIEKAQKDGNKEKKAVLKQSLYAFTPAAIFNKRRAYSDIISFTGLAVLDFDKINYVTEFKEYLFNTYKSIIACWISPSKKGVKAFVKIPIADNIEQFKEYFYGIASEMQIYNGFDSTSQNASLLMFISYDKNILIRNDYTVWTIKGEKKNEFSKSKPIKPLNFNPTNKQSEWVVNWYKGVINNISDEGHPQVRDNSVTLGGYVSSGFLSYTEAISLAEYLIYSNSYLQKGPAGYLKTAIQSINLGMTKPLKFN